MQVIIESIDQKLLLNGKSQLVTFLTLELPNGEKVSAQVAPDVAQTLISLVPESTEELELPSVHVDVPLQTRTHPLPVQPPATEQAPEDEIFSASDQPEEPEQQIEWAALPDEHLSPQMKKILQDLGAAPVMPATSLVALVDQITERLIEQKQTQQPQPVVGKPQQLQVARPKTVPRDEMGYPVVAGQSQDRDPGEVALMGEDEDGVPQL